MARLTIDIYMRLRDAVKDAGHGEDLVWANSIPKCQNADDFLEKYVWVLCHSGMRYKTGVTIFEKIMQAIKENSSIEDVFGHKGKVSAILRVQKQCNSLFKQWNKLQTAQDRVEWCGSLPWIGEITRYHLARDLGEMRVCKPDRHIERIAKHSGEQPQEMCERLAIGSGDTVACVDAVLWWAAVLKQTF